MRVLLAIAETGVASIVRYRLRSVATIAGLLAVLLPYVVGMALSQGIEQEARQAIHAGADLYITGSQFGRNVPIPVSVADTIGKIEGVETVIPRIVGEIVLGTDATRAVLVGVPDGHFPATVDCVEGRLPTKASRNEIVMGSELARRLRLRVGDVIPPFYRSRKGEKVSEVVGIFRADVTLWQAHVVFTNFETAAAIFDQAGLATDLLVSCRTGYSSSVQQAILRSVHWAPSDATGNVASSVVARDDLEALLPRGLGHREGIFNLLCALAFAVSILVVLVTSGVGLSAHRREIGILKATGWQTDEILLRHAVASLFLSLTSASLAVILAYVWLEWLNGFWVASIFLTGADAIPGFKVPYRLAPIPSLLGFLIALVIVMTGTLYSAWRTATAPPFEAMRSAR